MLRVWGTVPDFALTPLPLWPRFLPLEIGVPTPALRELQAQGEDAHTGSTGCPPRFPAEVASETVGPWEAEA